MSLFKELELTAEVFKALDNADTKITTEDVNSLTPICTIPLNIIQIGDQDSIIEGDILGEFRANVRGENQSLLKRGYLVRIIGQNQVYRLERTPKKLRMFDRTRIYCKLT